MEEMVSIRRAAAIAGIAENTVRRWIKQKKVSVREEKVGHVLAKLVSVKEVEKLAREIRTGRPPRGGRG